MPRLREVDPENVLLWRMPRRRLEAEAIRDGIMTVSGEPHLRRWRKHPSLQGPRIRCQHREGRRIDYDRPIRAVYIPVVRSSMYDVFQAFDLPDPSTSNGDRDSTVVAPQALFMMNSSVILKHSRKMADRSACAAGVDDALEFAKPMSERSPVRPRRTEIDLALSFIARIEQQWQGDKAKAWQSFCKALLASNEFMYLN